MYKTLISAKELAERLRNTDWVIIDCRFTLIDTEQGRRDYNVAHIQGALYAHLDEDLCGKIIPGKTGRHPLPPIEDLVKTFSRWGINSQVQVVAYDDSGGAMAAARLWWLLRWLGHEAVAVLDGGWTLWKDQGHPVGTGAEIKNSRKFIPDLRKELHASTKDILREINDQGSLILDSRAIERYRGEIEPIDPVAGHIPTAKPAPYQDNLDSKGKFLQPEILRRRFQEITGSVPAKSTVFYCGSGVTAAQNVLAVAYAGLGDAKLYAGSWSEWITDPRHPVATGNE
jgi:thiosulfate/3-mercaptopyruvate sulfurtransferase